MVYQSIYPPSKKINYNNKQYLLTDLKFIGVPENSTIITSKDPINLKSKGFLEENSTSKPLHLLILTVFLFSIEAHPSTYTINVPLHN